RAGRGRAAPGAPRGAPPPPRRPPDLVSTLGGALTIGRIVEVEAYVGPHDPASHAAERIGRTARNATMFGGPGVAYVYRIYGLHWCLNAVTGEEGFPAAVLIRAVEPLAGLDAMRRRRVAGSRRGASGALADRDLARGPARLAEALGITGALDGHALDREPLLVRPGEPVPPERIGIGPRIGITRAVDWPLRFFVRGSPWVSR
ncbi:MAG: DNA-3-methyladenine glycosylase, partial [Gemmatimonadetes bacterium]|nr:DNA-3-methyladenine glycosylase [Gemmatimonadota bacterium]